MAPFSSPSGATSPEAAGSLLAISFLFPFPLYLSKPFRFCSSARQSSFLFAGWAPAWFMNCLRKPIRSSVLCWILLFKSSSCRYPNECYTVTRTLRLKLVITIFKCGRKKNLRKRLRSNSESHQSGDVQKEMGDWSTLPSPTDFWVREGSIVAVGFSILGQHWDPSKCCFHGKP